MSAGGIYGVFNNWQDLGRVHSELRQDAAREGPGDPCGSLRIPAAEWSGGPSGGEGQGCGLRTEMVQYLTNGPPVPVPRLLPTLVVGKKWVNL